MEFFALFLLLWYPCYRLAKWLLRRERMGAERYFQERMKNPEYRAAYEKVREEIARGN